MSRAEIGMAADIFFRQNSMFILEFLNVPFFPNHVVKLHGFLIIIA